MHGDSWRHWWSGRVDAFQDQLQTHPESRVLFVFSREIRSHNTYEYQYVMYIITRVKQTPLRFSGHLRSLVFHRFPSQAHWKRGIPRLGRRATSGNICVPPSLPWIIPDNQLWHQTREVEVPGSKVNTWEELHTGTSEMGRAIVCTENNYIMYIYIYVIYYICLYMCINTIQDISKKCGCIGILLHKKTDPWKL